MNRQVYDDDSTLGEILESPFGRDIFHRVPIALSMGAWVVHNPITKRLKWKHVRRLLNGVLSDEAFNAALKIMNDHPDKPTLDAGPDVPPWWRSAVFYQIYPRSFADSNGDGIGDLRGIINKLDYLHDLGVDCLWLSPVYQSPNKDNGYDISDYRDIMTEMGTLADMDELIAGAHERGMRLIMDLVVNHTSDQHPWFQTALQDPDSEEAHYYILRDGNPDEEGGYPNNWKSYFSGPAWREIGDDRYALALFAQEQPDLNWDNPKVREEVRDIVKWWMDRGVDGFRMDVINFISKYPELPDGDETLGELFNFVGVEWYVYGPHLHDYLAELRRTGFTREGETADAPGKDPVGVMIGETPGVGMEVARVLTSPGRDELDLVFLFDHLVTPGKDRWNDPSFDLTYLKRHYQEYHQSITQDEWISVFWENHDNPRLTTRVDPRPEYRSHVSKVLATILLTMKGTPFIYQGQEIGAANQDFQSIEDFRDVETINRYEELEAEGKDGFEGVRRGSRDHARTPMRWTAEEPNHGFTTGEPWIGFHENSTGFTVEEQQDDPDSVLNWYKMLISLRRAHPALTLGTIEFVRWDITPYFAYFREDEHETWFVEMNLSGKPLKRPRLDFECQIMLGTAEERGLMMAPYEAMVCRVLPRGANPKPTGKVTEALDAAHPRPSND